ncbi:PQQ-binding-like beta-propeller repeat protein [Actinoplanes utahensis]|uniref:Pyrrolo-quinoline quinone repeat domain-containing protein n=1 Tax=Actinoplanes utahensis TaxID=1869 RepID=A0A0A6UJ84_ACTUT|nr:PQQ-binding-like beta-propeller repeat protein [Actinoplanes utahensis]KHD75511.1 hypothetical protein MB27_22035 [Actinoplanes utahensis]GIF32301.1 hypothetical protein Aut01nite_52870 [Actinoplanes utahensis]
MAVNRAGRAVLLALLCSVLATVAAVAVIAGIRDEPGPVPNGPDGDGGTVAWSVETATGSWDAHVVGDTAVVLDGKRLLGLNAADGNLRWSLPFAGEGTTFTVAGGMVAVQRGTDGPVDVVAPDAGRIVWSTPGAVRMVARDDALYLDSCPDRDEPADDCAIVKRRIADGATAWSVPDPPFLLQEDVIGGRPPLAPPAAAYLPVTTSSPGKNAQGALLDAASGRLLPGRVGPRGWYVLAAGDLLVTTDHDPPRGARDCPVAVDAVDGRSGRPAWKGVVYSGRRAGDECRRRLSDSLGGTVMFGSGGAIAAVDRNDRTTLTDLRTGKVRWTAEKPGVPIACDERTLLVRDNGESGPVSLLGLDDGRPLWTVPDPGLASSSASWESAVAGDLVAVMSATGDRPYVQVHDARTGRQLARRGGWLTGIGDGWVMVSTSAGATGAHLKLYLLRF